MHSQIRMREILLMAILVITVVIQGHFSSKGVVATNIVLNGNFSNGLENWVANDDVIGFANPNGLYVTSVFDLANTNKALYMYKFNAGGSGGYVGVIQPAGYIVQSLSQITVSFDVKIKQQTLSCGGYGGGELPAVVGFNYLDSYSALKEIRVASYITGTSCNFPSHVKATKISQDTWTRISQQISTSSYDIQKIVKIWVSAEGWIYETYIANVKIEATVTGVFNADMVFNPQFWGVGGEIDE